MNSSSSNLFINRCCCCCSVIKWCLTFCNPMDCRMPGFLFFTTKNQIQSHYGRHKVEEGHEPQTRCPGVKETAEALESGRCGGTPTPQLWSSVHLLLSLHSKEVNLATLPFHPFFSFTFNPFLLFVSTYYLILSIFFIFEKGRNIKAKKGCEWERNLSRYENVFHFFFYKKRN